MLLKQFQGERIVRDFWGKLNRDQYFFFEAARRLNYSEGDLTDWKMAADEWNPLHGKVQHVNAPGGATTVSFEWEPSNPFPKGLAVLSRESKRLMKEVQDTGLMASDPIGFDRRI